MLDPAGIIFTFNMSKPSQHTLLDLDTDWFLTDFNSHFAFIGQVSIAYIRQLLKQAAYTLHFIFNENHFPVTMGK